MIEVGSPDATAALTATEVVAAIAGGEITAEAYAEGCLARGERSPGLNAIIALDADAVRAAARGVDAARLRGDTLGPLAGLPLLVKDNIDAAGYATTAGTKGLAANRPRQDAPVLAALLRAGAFVLAKTNMHELAFGITSTNDAFGHVHNPYGKGLISGGSSGGTAAAVAARVAPAGLGSDTGGSARVPPALCGIAGFRPTVGNGQKRYPDRGVVPISHTRDTVGPIARTVVDLVLLDGVITGKPAPAAAQLKGLRLGVPRGVFWENLDAELAVVMDAAMAALKDAGVILVEADLTGIAAINEKVGFPVALFEVGPDLEAYLAAGGSGITLDEIVRTIAGRDVAGAFGAAATITREMYETALNVERPKLQALYADYFREHGVAAIVFPTTPLPARPINAAGDSGQDTVDLNGMQVPTFPTYIRNCDPGSNAGIPGLSVPAGVTRGGLPVGIEFDGPIGGDDVLLAIGLAAEQILASTPPPG